MPPSDDDLFDDDDDFILDEQTIAALDVIDAKIQLERNKQKQAAAPTNAQPPPAKRQRLQYEQELDPITSLDHLPEITVQGNGRYGIPQGDSTLYNSSSNTSGNASPVLPKPPPSRTALQRRPEPVRRQTTSRPVQPVAQPARPPPAQSAHIRSDTEEELKRQLQELQNENAKMQKTVKDANNARYAKDGEATILRQNLEKAAKEHAQKLLDVKTKLDEAGHKLVQMQRDIKEEREKMQTQLAFKNQEFEAARKLYGSVQKSQRRDTLATPLRPTQAVNDHWNASGPNTSPKLARRSPEKKSQKLRGFQNAFVDSTPLQSKLKKGKARAAELGSQLQNNLNRSPPSSPTRNNGDIDMMDVFADPPFHAETPFTSSPPGEPIPIESDLDMSVVDIPPLNWNAELHRILLTHKDSSAPLSSLQVFINASVPEESQAGYRNTVSLLLQGIGNYQSRSDYHGAAASIASSLLSLLSYFLQHNLIESLIILLNLLCILIYTLPTFSSILLSRTDNSERPSPVLLVTLSNLITEHLHPPKEKEYPTRLVTQVLNILDALCYNPVRENVQQLVYLSQNREVYANLLHGQQPTWVLLRVVQFLTLQLTHASLAQNLLVAVTVESPQVDHRFPVLDRLCSFVVDTHRHDAEGTLLKAAILAFIGLLSACQPDAITSLSDSQVLVPSLVVFLTTLTTPIWQDDDILMSAPMLTASVIRLVTKTIHLLHRLAYDRDPPLNLRSKLQRAPVRHFNGILHMFTLTFGRLTYGTPPDWISDELKPDLVVIAEFAQELLDLVVDGPDNDSVWLAFQENPNDGNRMEEDTMEEKLIGDSQSRPMSEEI